MIIFLYYSNDNDKVAIEAYQQNAASANPASLVENINIDNDDTVDYPPEPYHSVDGKQHEKGDGYVGNDADDDKDSDAD